jgi:rhodanese-related sulfurtransferase
MVDRPTVPDVIPAPGNAIGEILDAARMRLRRLDPVAAYAAMRDGATLIDIRSQAQRAADGLVPGALHVERNVLEWRLDPRSEHRIPEATGYDQHVIIMCAQGYASSLAAASLQDIGLHRATDLVGGYIAWAEAGLPTRPLGPEQDGCVLSTR